MTSRLAVTAILLIALAAGAADAAAPEFRAIQVHHWRDGGLSPQQIDQTIKWAKDANFNILQFQVRRVGDAYYNSAYEPRGSNIAGGADFDPLGYAIKKGHQNGLEVHAWVNTYRVWTNKASNPASANHVVNKHPEWINKSSAGSTFAGEGMFLDPGAPGVREYIVKLVADILSKYDVDGIMLDLVRYSGREWGYSDAAVAAFNAKHGKTGKPAATDELWCQWRRDQVTETVRAISQEIKRLKPWVKLSAATIVYGGCPSEFKNSDAYAHCFQDWRLWMEQGIIDLNLPMNYKDPANEKHGPMYTGWLDGMKKWSYARTACTTIMLSKDNNVDGAIKQVQQARAKGLGIVGFAFSQNDAKSELGRKLRASVFTEPASVPKLSWKPDRKSAN
jgi:uncharacterized lipoprotein YddW (UPF0748 family)